MQNRFVLHKVILMTVVAIALIAIPTLTLADSRDNLKSKTGEQTLSLKINEQEVSGLKKLVRYQRSTYLWPYATGPYYGDAPANLMHTPHWLRTMVGSFDTSNPVFNLPGELRKDLSPLSQTGMQYFIVQFDPDAFDNGKFQNLRKEFEGMGVQFFDYLSNRAFIVMLNAANYAIVSSSSAVKLIEPYHPAFKISPQVGRYPLLDPVKAVSPIYSLDVMVFPNESAELVAMQISQMGGLVKTVAGDTINVDIDRSQLGNIAKLEAVRAIYENIQIVLHGEETTSTMQVGNNSGPAMAIPYFDVGIDGGGADFDADGTKEIAPQKLQVIDSGISLDAKDLSHTNSVPGTAGSSHRKVFKYISTSGFPGGSGDTKSCDEGSSGGFTHGHTVSCTALGNASDVPPSYGDPEFFYDEYENPWKIDGVAKGALLLMYDCYVTPATGVCSQGCTAGDLYNASSPGSSVLGDGYIDGARAANMSWGGGLTYGTQPQDIDTFLNASKDAMVFTSAGNDGVDADQDDIPDERSVTSPANTKNGIALGMCYTANTSSTYNPNARSSTSSVGPVGPNLKPRVKPDLMAPGDDPWGFGSNMGMDSEYSCRSDDNDQVGTPKCEISQGLSGTSVSSPAAMGSFALVKDYFAQGFYPDGTSANDNNLDDTMENISGALVKAILIASTDFMTGVNLTKDYRFNYEQGYGRIQLTNALPLVTDPSTPTGLIIDDQGLDAGTGIGAGSFAQDTFEVTDVNEPLRVVAAWVEGVGEDLINDLDLIVAYDTDEDGTIDPDEPTWWGNYFTEDQLRGATELTRDSTLETDEDNDGNGTLDSSEWSLRIVDGAKAQKDFLNPNEGVFISVEDLGGGAKTELTGQWIWRLEADSGNPDTQRYAIAIAGGVALGSSIRFDKAPVLCADIVHVTVYEIDDGSPPNASQVSSNTTIYVDDPGPDGEFDTTDDVTYDSETGITFTQQGTAYRFLSEDLPASDAGTQTNDNGILDIVDGYRLTAKYIDASETKTKFSIIGTDCTVKLNKGVTFVQWGRNYTYLIDGGCEINDLGLSFPDKYMDIDEKLVYWIAIWNGDSDLLDVTVKMDALIPGTTNPSPYVNIITPTKNLGTLNADSTMGVPFEVEITGSPTFPTEVEMRLGLEASKSGKTVKEYRSFTHLINADDEVFHYSTDFPTGGIVTRDYNNDEYVEDISSTSKDKGGQLDAPGEDWDFWYETYKFSDLTDTGFGGGNPSFNGPWNFDASDDEGFRSGIHPDSTQGALQISNWGEDMNWDNALQAGEDRDPADGTLNQNYATQHPTLLECGYQTERGIWHTGTTHGGPRPNTPCAGSGLLNRCQFYEIRTGTTGADFFFEILKSPEVQKVHINLDTNDYEYYSEFHFMTLQWNQQVDLVDEWVQVIYEVDTNTETDIGVKLDDFTVLGLFNGPMTIREGGTGNQNLLDGFSVFAPSDSLGNETNGTVGNNRVGSRGCYFQSGDNIDTKSPHGLAKPEDDDLDNDSDGTIDEYVTNAGPIRNMDTQKNNGLPASWTLEDLYGDAGTKYQAAFGFFVSEGTVDSESTAGYGIALDDIVLEWDEMHPIQDEVDCSTNGQCASLSVKTLSMYEGNSLVPIIILDFNAQTTQGNTPHWNDLDEDGDGTPDGIPDLRDDDSNSRYEIIIHASSEAEPDGEYFWLEQTSVSSFEYSGVIPISSTYNTEGTIYIQRKGADLPTLTVKYIDKNDGVTAHTYSNGTDGQPGVAAVDDDADSTTDEEDERCPLGAGDILRPYGDDICGCPNNPLEISSSIEYAVGRMSIAAVTQVIDYGDDDGFADACERVTIDITLMNLARIGGEFADLTSVSANIQVVYDADNDGTEDNTVACILDPSAYYGDIPMLTSKTNPTSDRFEFQVACDVNRTDIYEEVNAVFDLNVTAGEIGGLYQPLRIVIPLDLDRTGGGSAAPELFEDFESGSNKFTFSRVAQADGIRCQYNDPDNPDGFSYNRANCELDSAPYMDQDWHIHGTSSPDSGRATSGDTSMHWGYHKNAADAGEDTLHLQEMHKATLKTTEKVFLGMGAPILSFKHQLNMLDSRGSNTPSGEGADRAIVMLAKTNASGVVQCDPNDTDRCWYKVFPFDNVYNVQGTDQFSNCTFDPTDDGSNEDDFFPNTHFWGPSSTCFPEFVWTWMGDTDHESVFDPENYGAGNGPGLPGTIGPGTWVESKFNLSQYKGYTILFRFLATTIEIYPAQDYIAAGWPTDTDWDDGWYVDDIRITNRITSAMTLSDDSVANPSPTCPTDPAQNCDTIYPELDCLPDDIDNDQDGSVDEAGEDNCATLAPGHTFMLSAAESSANKCVDGSLTYKFWLDSDSDGTITDEPGTSILYDWSARVTYPDNPVGQQKYCVEVRCATDTNCVDYTCVDAGPAPLGPGIVIGLVFNTAKTTISWNAAVNGAAYDTIKGDLDVLISTGGNFTTSLPGGSSPDDYQCINSGSSSTSTSVPYTPTAAGQGFYYLVRAENVTALNGTYSTEIAREEAGRDSEIAASGNDCP